MVGVRAPRAGIPKRGDRRLRGRDDFLRCALGAFHFPNRLLGKDGGEAEFLKRGEMAGCGEAQPVAKAE